MINQSINLNLIPGAIPPRIKVSQYDEGSRTLIFMLYNGSSQYAGDTGITAKIQGTKPDGHGFCYDATYGQETGYCYVTADLTRQMTVVAGAVTCEIVLEKNSQVLGTGNFILDVEAGALSDDTDISDTEIPAIIDLAETNAERAEDAADRAEAASAHAPYIGNNEHWYVWDSTNSQYVDSGVDAKGDDGASIVSVTKTSTSGYVDTYTITMSDGTTSTFTVTNGTSTLPGGGTKGQVLTKKSGTTGDADWSSDLELGKVGWDAAASSVKKNLLKNTAFSRTESNVTAIVNDDESVTISTTNAGASDVFLVQNRVHLEVGQYTLTGCPEGGSNSTYRIDYTDPQDGLTYSGDVFDYGNSGSINVTHGGSLNIRIRIAKNTVITTPITFYPMLRMESITNADYAPGFPDNVELDKGKYNTAAAIRNGAHNLAKPSSVASSTDNGVAYTNADGIVTANNQATADSKFSWDIGHLPVGKYRITGCPSGGSASKYCIRIGVGDTASGWGTYVQADYGDGAEFEVNDATKFYSIGCRVFNGYTASNLVFKPMITDINDSDKTYAPYAMTNRELTIRNVFDPNILSSTDDLDNITTSGIYYFITAPINSPESVSYSPMLVIKRDQYDIRQIIWSSTSIYLRSFGGSPASWKSWRKVELSVVS